MCFINYPRIRLLDEWTQTFEEPLHVKAAVSTLDTWVRANVNNQALPRSVWQDIAAIQERTPRVCLPPDNEPEKEIVYPGNLRPDVVEYILNDATDFLQAKGHILWNAQRTWRQFRLHCAMYYVIVAWNRSSRCVHE